MTCASLTQKMLLHKHLVRSNETLLRLRSVVGAGRAVRRLLLMSFVNMRNASKVYWKSLNVTCEMLT